MTILCAEYGGQRIMLPNTCRTESKKQKIMQLLEEKMLPRDIALQMGVTDRWVRAVASQMREYENINLPD